MSPPPFLTDFARTARRCAARIRGRHVVALSAVVVAAFGLTALRGFDLPGPRAIADGERITIEVVQPVEPDVVPGSVMEVGELIDGFTGPPPRPPETTPVGWSGDEAWNEAYDAPPPRRPAVEPHDYRPVEADVGPPPRRRPESRWFGFDAPRRDFEAERAVRRARMEAMERRVWEEREEARRRDLAWRAERERDEARWRDRDRRRDDRDRDPDDGPTPFTGPQ